MRTEVRLSCTGKQMGGGLRPGGDLAKRGTERNPLGRAKSKTYLLGRVKRKRHREREAHRARGLRLTGLVGGRWQRADPDCLRTFDSHLEWQMH